MALLYSSEQNQTVKPAVAPLRLLLKCLKMSTSDSLSCAGTPGQKDLFIIGCDCQVTYFSGSTAAVQKFWVVLEAIVTALHLGLQKVLRSKVYTWLAWWTVTSWSKVVGTTEGAVILKGPGSILMYSERPIIISSETRSGTRAGQGTKH